MGNPRFSLAAAALAFATTAVPLALHGQAPSHGERLYMAQCSRCHGIEGSGGQGPVLARSDLRFASDAEDIGRIIVEGLPGGGMPGNWTLSVNEVSAVAEYVMGLGRVATEDLQGDAAAGRALFFGNGRCTRCHIVAGQGNGFGPELTEIGARRGAANLRASITDPSGEMPLGIGVFRSRGFASHLTVQVSPAGGDPVLGIRLNEDTFTIQVMDRRGGIYSFRKGEADLDKQFDRSLMPTRDLSDSQVEDLVAYLATLRGATPKAVSD